MRTSSLMSTWLREGSGRVFFGAELSSYGALRSSFVFALSSGFVCCRRRVLCGHDCTMSRSLRTTSLLARAVATRSLALSLTLLFFSLRVFSLTSSWKSLSSFFVDPHDLSVLLL